MILVDHEILKARRQGLLKIEPWNEAQLNPNSYNLKLHRDLLVYDPGIFRHIPLDPKKPLKTRTLTIPDEGLCLEPGVIYLGRTEEYTETLAYVPMIEGRSSIGRLGVFVHVTAGFGDVGFSGFWTLELACVQPVVLYPGMEVCQIFYHTVENLPERSYSGKYQNNSGVQPSLIHQEFKQEEHNDGK